MELEDDAYFADLSKQISLLIMDEDEDPLTSCHPHSLQVFPFHLHTLARNRGFKFHIYIGTRKYSNNYGTLMKQRF